MPNRTLLSLAAAALLGSIAAAPIALAGATPDTGHPPLCTDAQYQKKVRSQYDGYEEMNDSKIRIREWSDVKETHFGPSSDHVNRLANAEHRSLESRYCSAHLVLTDGGAETLYWRLDYIVDRDSHYVNLNLCSLRHDAFEDQCEGYIAGK